MTRLPEVMAQLEAHAEPGAREGMARFGMTTEHRLGVKVPEIRRLAKTLGRDHALAFGLWDTGVADARILASMVADPAVMTGGEIEAWVAELDSWDVCDQVCMNLFEHSGYARAQIPRWARREETFVKRAAFALIACLAWHDKKAADDEFITYLGLIEANADDDRNFVKKAVNWALRTIGKRNPALHGRAIQTAGRLKASPTKSGRWIGSDALRELESDKIRARLSARG
jgi:3-methyladenine DNA glycosylase AlkD